MRVAVVSDLHANLHAVQAVAKDMEDARVDQVWCLGDIVGYGAHPREVLAWVEEHVDVVVKGNHDHAVATGDAENFNPIAASAARYHAQLLTPPERAKLHDLPTSKRLPWRAARGDAGEALLVHASPDDPLHEYVYPSLARPRLVKWAGATDLILLGHTHVPFLARLEDGSEGRAFAGEAFREVVEERGSQPRALTVVNPGSVGQPRDGDVRASYAIVDLDARRVSLRRVAYDVDAAAMAIQRAGLDRFLASRLYKGV